MPDIPDTSRLIEWGFKALLGGGVSLAVWQLKAITHLVAEMKEDLIRFSERMSWHKEKIDSHETRIDNHETRIIKLEEKTHARR